MDKEVVPVPLRLTVPMPITPMRDVANTNDINADAINTFGADTDDTDCAKRGVRRDE